MGPGSIDWSGEPATEKLALCYDALGIDNHNAPLSEIRHKCMGLVLRHHPDMGGDPTCLCMVVDAYHELRATMANIDASTTPLNRTLKNRCRKGMSPFRHPCEVRGVVKHECEFADESDCECEKFCKKDNRRWADAAKGCEATERLTSAAGPEGSSAIEVQFAQLMLGCANGVLDDLGPATAAWVSGMSG